MAVDPTTFTLHRLFDALPLADRSRLIARCDKVGLMAIQLLHGPSDCCRGTIAITDRSGPENAALNAVAPTVAAMRI